MFIKISLLSISALLITACVTVNVYFPVAAAAEVADKFVGHVYQTPKTEEKPTEQPTESPEPTEPDDVWGSSLNISWPMKLANILIAPAYAEINIDISSQRIQTLRDNMTARHQHLKRGYDIGAIGITNNGLIILRDSGKIPLKNIPKIKRWIEEENQERYILYKEIALANGHPEWETDIKTIFISRWIELAESGWWYQDTEDQWQRKQ